MTTKNKQIMLTLLGSLVWAVLFIASAKFLKGEPAKVWVQAVLYGLGFFVMYFPLMMRSRSRSC